MLILLIHNNKVGHRINKWVAESTKWVTESTKWVTESTNGVITESTKWVWGTVSVNSIFIIIVYNKDYSGLQNDILSASTLGYLVEEPQPPEADIIIIEQHQDRHRSQEPIELMNKDIVQEGWRCSQWS